MDTMRLSLCRKVKEASPPPLDSSEQTTRRKDSSSMMNDSTKENAKIDSFEMESRSETANAREVEQVPSERITKPETEASMDVRSNTEGGGEPHFRGMRPTSWSPPPGKPKHRYKINNSDSTRSKIGDEPLLKTSWSTSNPYGSSKVEIGSASTETSNVYKITVSPRASPLVHRLQIGPTGLGNGSRRTSILINGDATQPMAETSPDNKVTISVGGEDSVYNPTVISVNSENPPRIKSSGEKTRTLVILDNYKSNIVVASGKEDGKEDTKSKPLLKTIETAESVSEETLEQRSRRNTESESNSTTIPETIPVDCEKRTTRSTVEGGRCSLVERNAKFQAGSERTAENSSKVASLSKEALISKLLEDSLRKARENGEILDEDSGEAILKILKQSLLKSKEYEGSESTLEANYSRASSLNSDGDFISTNLFLEENPYEVIKEPIYEEIPDEPPPLPLSPPPTEDYIKDRIYFGDIDYYRKSSSDQFLGSYLTDNVYKKSNSEDLGETYLSKSPEDFFKKMSTSPEEGNISSKFELLNFLMDTKDRAISIEEEEDEDDEDEEDTEGDLEALYEQKETSLGDLSSKSSQISNVSDSSEECNIILTSSSETSKVSFYIYIYN